MGAGQLIPLFLIERQILPTPLLYLSAFFEASRRDYYDGLLRISEHCAQALPDILDEPPQMTPVGSHE